MEKKNKSVENCNLCGACNFSCPIYALLQKESAGPRFKAFLAKEKDYREIFLLCTECEACAQDCPANIDIGCLMVRAELVNKGLETQNNKTMRDNIKTYGNPFGIPKGEEKTKKIKQYYT
jgi:Fe-S oxidoreductase